AVLVTPRCADPLYRRSIRVSMGTVFQVPWTRIENWPMSMQELKGAGYLVAGLTLGEGAVTLDELAAQDHQDLALILGNEGHGLLGETDRQFDRGVTIPMLHGLAYDDVGAASSVYVYTTQSSV